MVAVVLGEGVVGEEIDGIQENKTTGEGGRGGRQRK